MVHNRELGCSLLLLPLLLTSSVFGRASATPKPPLQSVQQKTIGFSVNPADGSYTIFDPVSRKPILHSGVAAEIDHRWLRSNDYPKHSPSRQDLTEDTRPFTKFTVSNTGIPGQADLIYSVELHADPDFVTIAVSVHNGTSHPITVQAFRSVEATGPPVADLGATDASDRVLSDSFSEDRPGITIRSLADARNGMHRAVGSQLIYNLQSKRNLFLGTLTSDKFLTILRLHIDKDHISSYEVDSAGTTELELENSLEKSSAEDRMELSLPVAPGAELASEKLLISTGTDY